jgi:predicted nucleotidyltransferase
MNIKVITKELKEVIIKEFPDEKPRIILYGSYARGESNKHSDIDLLVIFNSPIDLNKKNKVYELCSGLNVTYDIWIDVSLISSDEMDSIRGKQPFIQNALNEGVYL